MPIELRFKALVRDGQRLVAVAKSLGMRDGWAVFHVACLDADGAMCEVVMSPAELEACDEITFIEQERP